MNGKFFHELASHWWAEANASQHQTETLWIGGVGQMPSYVRSSSVVSRVIAGETLIVPVRGGVGDLASIYSLNPVASSIWNAIAQPCSQDKIVERIEEEFAGERQRVEQDVKSFLIDMQSAGLISEVGTSA